ncbi:WAP four-disulfide core domain protein 3 [Neopsephotus bourkii]|uniref:WAP four-disulfide core domain protein 3 n=1 Tax=Neopsephotus bourkii TaxID=309878 RepID=UPI002AA54DD6|nr:WAP four-disulfide core domain protein 3 [Neopsephotus bourkii]
MVLLWEGAARCCRTPPQHGLNPGPGAQPQLGSPTAAPCPAGAASSCCSWRCPWSSRPPRPSSTAPGTGALPPRSLRHRAGPRGFGGPPLPCLPPARGASARRGGAGRPAGPGSAASRTAAALEPRGAALAARSGPASCPAQVPRGRAGGGRGPGPVLGSPLPGTRHHPQSPGCCPRTGSARSCRKGSACSPGQERCTRGCCARCLRTGPAKPGLCPRKRVQRSAVACSSRCAHDRDCSGNRKCCFSRCGLACASPDRVSRLTAVKPGTCPVVLRGSLGPCLELCDTDSDCPGAAKCCTTGCGHICKPPTEVRPGLCPPMADGDRAAECLLLCLQDRDCPREQKCCLRGCGRTCIPPLQGTA